MTAVINALTDGLRSIVAFLPALLGAILIVIVGWIVAAVLRAVTERILESVGFDRWVGRHGLKQVVEDGEGNAMEVDPSNWVARLVFWLVMIASVLLAFNALGLTAVNALLVGAIAYIPLIIVAIIEVVVAFVIASLVHDLVRGALGNVSGSDTIAMTMQYVIIAVGIFMALSQLGIAPVIVNSLFIALLAAMVLIASISFGIGGIDTAKKVISDWYASGQQKAKEIQREQEKQKAA